MFALVALGATTKVWAVKASRVIAWKAYKLHREPLARGYDMIMLIMWLHKKVKSWE